MSPCRAPVTPRVHLGDGQPSLPIEKRIKTMLNKGARGLLNLVGPAGSGKTTGLRHLAAVLDPSDPVVLTEGRLNSRFKESSQTRLVVFTSQQPLDPGGLTTFYMSPWSNDDLIEYLLGTHPGRCRSVMGRLTQCSGREKLHGLPELWRVVLDEMAADENVCDIDAALVCFLDRELCDEAARRTAEQLALFALALKGEPPRRRSRRDVHIGGLLRHGHVRMLLAARALGRGLCDATVSAELAADLPEDLVRRTASLIADVPGATRRLEHLTRATDGRVQAMAASILHATGIGWRPKEGHLPNLSRAMLPGAQWSYVDLPGISLEGADLREANLCGAKLTAARLDRAGLIRANLCGAAMDDTSFRGSNMTGADLTAASANEACFASANLSGAELCRSTLRRAVLRFANLTNARLITADLSGADLELARIDGANFSHALFDGSMLRGLPLRQVVLSGTSFRQADLTRCDLEDADADDCDFSEAQMDGALLTGSILRGTSFRGARLTNCGLADIDWEEVDLRDADLRGSSFHMGSTRSGLVDSDIPGEGTHTGFYTDDYYDRDFKPPGEVRKASLRGADLRDACIESVDFYLVDLRGARYSNSQSEYFNRCGAILD